MLNIKKL